MKNYFYQNQITQLDYVPKGYVVSDNFDDRFTSFVELTEEQNTFFANNPTANIFEVRDCEMMPTPMPEHIDPKEQREQAYATEPIILWDGKLRTCDFCRALILTYQLMEDSRENELRALWLAGREEIQNKYPEI